MNIWQFQDNVLNRRLLRWAGLSIVIGLLLQLKNSKFWKNLGWQFAGWGLINAGIAFFGKNANRDRVAKLENPGEISVRKKQRKNLKRILLFNAGLDVFYMLGGFRMTRNDEGAGGRAGTGWGIIIQGAFLFFFDLWHAQVLPDGDDTIE
ncbi:MAG: DUF6992 family protein [Aggregatilineales bacterium]